MDTSQWPQQEIVVKPMEENNSVIKPINSSSLESCRRVRAQRDEQQVLKYCPRCNSTNTKFCYYNNYSLSQPRYFCKTCRRYWTDGGTLRNIPVGGGSRKNNKRSSSSSSISQSSSASPSSKKLVLENRDSNSTENPKTIQENGQDLNLGFPESTTSNDFKNFSQLIKGPYFDNIANNIKNMQIPNGLTGIQSSMGLNINSSFMPIPMPIGSDHNLNTTFYSSLTTDHQFMKPMASSSFPLDNDQQLGISSTSSGGYNGNNGRILFPFEDLKMQASSNNATEPPTEDSEQQNIRGDGVVVDNSNGFWNGMLGAGGSW